MELIDLFIVSEERNFTKTFNVTSKLVDVVYQIYKELDLNPEMYDAYHDTVKLDLSQDLEIRDTDISFESNCIEILMSDKYKSFLKLCEAKKIDVDFEEYSLFHDKFMRIEELEPVVEHLQGQLGCRSVFKLRSLILFSEMYFDCEFLDEVVFNFIDKDLAEKCCDSGFTSYDDYIMSRYYEHLFDESRQRELDETHPMMSLDVLARLKEIEKFEWTLFGSFGYLDIYQGQESSVLGIYDNGGEVLAFLQHNDMYIVTFSGDNDGILSHNGFGDWTEGGFVNGFGVVREHGIESVFERMRGYCTSFFSCDDENRLFNALNKKDLAKVRRILLESPNLIESLNELDIPALLIAARIGWLDAVKVLLEFIQDPNKKYFARGYREKTLMSCAKKSENQELVEYLESIGVK